MGDPVKVKKLTGEAWGEILSKIRGSELSVADKVQALDFIAVEATKSANSVRHGDFDGKIADQIKVVTESVQTTVEEMNGLTGLVRESKLHKTQPPGLTDLAAIEGTFETLQGQLKKLRAFYESHSPSIVDRVGAIVVTEAPEPEHDLPF